MKSKTRNPSHLTQDQNPDVQKDCLWAYDELKTFFDYSSRAAAAIETLTLKFSETWQGTFWTNLFEYEPTGKTLSAVFLKTWREKFQSLQNLEMDLPIIRTSNESLEKIILPLFKALPSLKTFKCNPKYLEEDDDDDDDDEDLDLNPFPYDILDFTRFMDCIESKKELETFEINYQEEEYPLKSPHSTIKFQPKKQYCLPENLEKVSLCFRFFKDFDFHSFFGLFLANGSKMHLKLLTVYFDCPDAFNGFLRLVDERIADSKNLKLDLEISLYVDNLDRIFCYFNEPIVLNKQVAVKLNVILKPQEAGAPTLKITDEIKAEFGRIFGNFHHNFIEFKLFPDSDQFAFRYHIGSRNS